MVCPMRAHGRWAAQGRHTVSLRAMLWALTLVLGGLGHLGSVDDAARAQARPTAPGESMRGQGDPGPVERGADEPSADEVARATFILGREAYARGDYEAALAAFRRAHELSGRPQLLFNIGQAADRLRRDREALQAFEAYLTAMPEAENRVEVEARMRVLREQVARDEALRAELARASERRDAEEPPVVEQWWFWTLIGVGVAGAAVGIALAATSREELAPPTPGQLGPGGFIVALESP